MTDRERATVASAFARDVRFGPGLVCFGRKAGGDLAQSTRQFASPRPIPFDKNGRNRVVGKSVIGTTSREHGALAYVERLLGGGDNEHGWSPVSGA